MQERTYNNVKIEKSGDIRPMKPISKVAKAIAPSATLAISAMAKQMKADGIDVINFGAGEPDFDTPDYIKDAAILATKRGETKYTPAAGIPQLRSAICGWLKRNMDLDYKNEQIVVASGAKHAIYIALQAILNPGDEVILPAPYWVTYEEAIKMCGGIPVIINTTEEDGFKLSPETLEASITPNTKCFILTNPSNPTGAYYEKEELRALAEVLVRNDVYVMSDEIYCSLLYDGEYTSIAGFNDEIKERTIIINGVSKEYAMTGWRVGFAAANREIAKAMANYVSHSTGSPCTVSQFAAVEAYNGSDEEALAMKEEFHKRRDYFIKRVYAIDGVSGVDPKGAFYVFMNITGAYGKRIEDIVIRNSNDFCTAFLKYGLVACVPGSAFGADGYIRWSYATSMDNIRKGLDRLEEFLAKLQ